MTKLLRAQGEAGWDRKAALKRTVAGTAAALGTMLVLTVALVPLRASLTVATSALILIVPVVIGVVVGGFPAGVISVIAGFLVYDVFFIPPYLTWAVGAPQNWAALGVYLVVMVPVRPAGGPGGQPAGHEPYPGGGAGTAAQPHPGH